ncbi:MAG: methionyl-tRNA formyltransferase [Firmicutes bacterium]|nr:methionyl-tRNA formyltransferase [Bacillota bacterium]
MLNIVFMGTPDFAKKSLEAIYNKKHNIIAVFTVADKPGGRGMKLTYSPVKEYSLEKNFKIYQPEKLRGNEEIINTIKSLNPDIICVVAYGMILPKELLDIPKYGCINVHPSLLPKYRGSSPIQTAIINGDRKTGVTTMYIDEQMDSGDIILQKEVDIGDEETAGELWDRLSEIGAKLLIETLDKIEKDAAPRIKQGENFTLAPMLDKGISKIDWTNKTAMEIKNLVRGLNPTMGTYSYLNGRKLKFWKIDVLAQKDFIEKYQEFIEYDYKLSDVEPGTIIYVDKKAGLYIKAKDGIIKVLEVQAENAKKMSIQDFLRGNKMQVGDVFV